VTIVENKRLGAEQQKQLDMSRSGWITSVEADIFNRKSQYVQSHWWR
jgi:hypothetical protein